MMLGIITFIVWLWQYIAYPQKYKEYVVRYANEYGVPEYIVYSVIKVESGFDKGAVSKKGACGLMQLMPETYEWLLEIMPLENVSGKNEVKERDIFNEEENIKCGTYYLSILYKKYGSWELAFCAYNAGTGNVDKWLKEKPFYIRFSETQKYVNKLKVVTSKYKSLYYK
ncbi:MAG: lytic transglycosylase domain-containing protein [Clostridia bacterium]|nr:lytic transglycosylase domain-containing protein [Clostridia bacterium]